MARRAVGVVVVQQGRMLLKQGTEVAPQLMRIPSGQTNVGETDGGKVNQRDEFQ